MVTFYNVYGMREGVCLSTDTKPTETSDGFAINNGSLLYEMDTQTFFMYNADTDTWVEQ